MRLLRRFIYGVDGMSQWSERVTSWMMLAMMLVLVYEVFMRYVLFSPTIWAHESSTMLYGSYCVLVGAYTLLYKRHVRMDVIYRLLSSRVRAGLDCFTGVFAFGYLSLFIWKAGEMAMMSLARNEHSCSPWAPPVYPLKWLLVIAAFMLLLQVIAVFTRNFLAIRGRELSQ